MGVEFEKPMVPLCVRQIPLDEASEVTAYRHQPAPRRPVVHVTPLRAELMIQTGGCGAAPSVLKNGADDERRCGQDHEEDRRRPPPIRQLFSK